MKKLASAGDPLWYKDAVIYELHVRAFADSNNDGIGDFQGLISKLDYLQDLGVTCLWLLPFFPSPLRDDGYDIANYVDVNSSYGTLADFKQFLEAAHKRNMQVMIELVINHTSDQHPWFKAARIAAPGSPEREMYVWSNTDQLYKDARIIFTDTEKSNWTWDETAKAYYWHRFFSHQPDLNFDNPRVIEEVLNAMRFWLDLGVDALRMDAIPYLVERDNTNCENLPETHAAIKTIRAAIDADYANRLILAEANQWPADVRPYFGDGDECHMAFHFPLMPRIYMALRQEDRLPITDIMAQTPEIPASCQWGLFLRNHDELTLEMVTDDERDYMYFAYSADPRMRVNVGIRRRLAPLVDNNQRRIELLNSLLLSFPGTPIMYYGDEIGMGDNIYLGDRNGVRTPMQWNSDRNAGFSRCDPARLYFPVIMDPIYGYQVVNVESQLSDQSSLLHWTRNMIALRKLFQVFGRGTLEFLNPENRKILAYLRNLRRDDGSYETVLCCANLSRFAQPVSLDLKKYEGSIPVEMLGYVSFPAITSEPYPLTLAPYSFLWFELQPAPVAPIEESSNDQQVTDEQSQQSSGISVDGWSGLTSGEGLTILQDALRSWVPNQRWFGAKSRSIDAVCVRSYAVLFDGDSKVQDREAEETKASKHWLQRPALFLLEVKYKEGGIDAYQVPLALCRDNEETDKALQPMNIITKVQTPNGVAILCDAISQEEFRQALLRSMEAEAVVALHAVSDTKSSDAQTQGEVSASSSKLFVNFRGDGPLTSKAGSAEQSNTSILYSGKMILKLFRRLQSGVNPDIEIGRFLTEVAHFPHTAPLLGEIVVRTGKSENVSTTSLAMLQALIANEGDGWEWTLHELELLYDSVAASGSPKDSDLIASLSADSNISEDLVARNQRYAGAAALLGRRTAELHLALAIDTDNEAFRAEPITIDTLQKDIRRAQNEASVALDVLKLRLPTLPDEVMEDAAAVLSQRGALLSRLTETNIGTPTGKRIRIHGDYHLGQVLRADGDFVLLDFEGEPARPLEERRRKQCPLKDVAGMLRSFSYAAWFALDRAVQQKPENAGSLRAWGELWQNSVCSAFLASYREFISLQSGLLPEPAQAESLLQLYLLEKALYELVYELNNRPNWVRVPLAGILSVLRGSSMTLAA